MAAWYKIIPAILFFMLLGRGFLKNGRHSERANASRKALCGLQPNSLISAHRSLCTSTWETDNINADVDRDDQGTRKLPEKHSFVFSISQEVNSYLNPFSCPPTRSIAALRLLLHLQLLNGAEELWLPWRGPHPSGKPLLKSNTSKVPTALSVMGSCSSAEYPLIACHSQTF